MPSQKEFRNLSDTKKRNIMSDEVKAPSSSAETIPESLTAAEGVEHNRRFWYQQQLVQSGEER